MSEQLDDIQRALGRVEAQLETLVGNGQPGLIKEMRDDIDSLKDSRSNARGYIAGAGVVLTLFEGTLHYILHKAGVK